MGMVVSEAEKAATTGKPDAKSSHSKPDVGVVKDAAFAEGHAMSPSHNDRRKRFKGATRVLIRYLRWLSPINILKKGRDCYVGTLSGCAESYSTVSFQGHGMGYMNGNSSPLHSSFPMMTTREELYLRSERCLSPAFRKSFNEIYYKNAGGYLDADGGSSPFRKSFSDFESSVSPTMKRSYSEAEALCRFPTNAGSGYCRRSPGWSPKRAAGGRSPGWTPKRVSSGGQSLMIFPIQEVSEHTRASFRKDSQEFSLASVRKDSDSSFRKEAGLASIAPVTTSNTTTLASLLETPEGFRRPMPLLTVSSV